MPKAQLIFLKKELNMSAEHDISISVMERRISWKAIFAVYLVVRGTLKTDTMKKQTARTNIIKKQQQTKRAHCYPSLRWHALNRVRPFQNLGSFTKTIRKLRLGISILQLLINFRRFIRFLIRRTSHNFKRIKKLLTHLTTVEHCWT